MNSHCLSPFLSKIRSREPKKSIFRQKHFEFPVVSAVVGRITGQAEVTSRDGKE
jgi:hypothetical protein